MFCLFTFYAVGESWLLTQSGARKISNTVTISFEIVHFFSALMSRQLKFISQEALIRQFVS